MGAAENADQPSQVNEERDYAASLASGVEPVSPPAGDVGVAASAVEWGSASFPNTFGTHYPHYAQALKSKPYYGGAAASG
jgi:hypothetical protein